MRFHNSRLIPDGFTIKAVTVRKRQDGWYISVRMEDKSVPEYISKPLTEVEKVLGCDLGITKLSRVYQTVIKLIIPVWYQPKTKHLLKVRQRRVSRKVKGSKNRKKAAKKVGRLHKRVSDKRLAYQWYVANKIVSRNVDGIGLEDLNVSGMLRRCKVKVDEKTGRF
ncbi:RNA-guided endonuclease InsQ/TnpB family protein [Tolypothrix bouteillei VB521301_2]|uniref:RNA-guided endonuclease InsQ/TnpB family protein n=1 Tax=Tolypothrix bouteillei TaxID=1246981 RepID=UPI0038B5247F